MLGFLFSTHLTDLAPLSNINIFLYLVKLDEKVPFACASTGEFVLYKQVEAIKEEGTNMFLE